MVYTFKHTSQDTINFVSCNMVSFNSLVKMIYGFAAKSRQPPNWSEMEHAIRRNFGGLDNVNPLQVFSSKIQNVEKFPEVSEKVFRSFNALD